jgi:DNA helicase HerA-like ATPase
VSLSLCQRCNLTNARSIEKDCSEIVETLLRQGRKYGLGGCIATQRIAYLNTNALQQLHTYFVPDWES